MGSYLRLAEPRCIRRFRCLHCDVTFSSRTFPAAYWPEIFSQLMTKGLFATQIELEGRWRQYNRG
ncbi:MAG: hypothetical protein R6X25_14615, partial [Candidatus Krumholzibacteriia bacterium]